MARQGTAFRGSKSIAGAVLVGFGTLILYENLAGPVAHLRHLLGANGSEALGVLPAVVLTTSQAVQGDALDHQNVWQGLLRTLVWFWPLLLVVVGTILLRDGFTDKVKTLPRPDQYFKKNFSKIKTLDVDFATLRSTNR
jgi:uncharacterized membrane protein